MAFIHCLDGIHSYNNNETQNQPELGWYSYTVGVTEALADGGLSKVIYIKMAPCGYPKMKLLKSPKMRP